MAQDYARWFYDSNAWKKTREIYMSSQQHICEECGEIACVVHHIQPITPDNIRNPEITLSLSNLKALCDSCHTAAHSKTTRTNGIAFDESGNVIKKADVFLICGSPASGKSAYVTNQKKSNDLIVDLDYICAALMGEPGSLYLNHAPILSVALEVRTLLYTIIKARRGQWGRAYVITTIANASEQRAISNELNAELIIMDTPENECIERLQNDARRVEQFSTYKDLIVKWHEVYTKSLRNISNTPTF